MNVILHYVVSDGLCSNKKKKQMVVEVAVVWLKPFDDRLALLGMT